MDGIGDLRDVGKATGLDKLVAEVRRRTLERGACCCDDRLRDGRVVVKVDDKRLEPVGVLGRLPEAAPVQATMAISRKLVSLRATS